MDNDKSPCLECPIVWMDKELCLLIKCERLNEYQQGIRGKDLFIGEVDSFRDQYSAGFEVREYK